MSNFTNTIKFYGVGMVNFIYLVIREHCFCGCVRLLVCFFFIIQTFVSVTLLQAAQCDTIPIVIIQHGIREKPYNDTLACSWFKFQDDTITAIEYFHNTVRITRSTHGRRWYSRRFYTILKLSPEHIVLILKRKQLLF